MERNYLETWKQFVNEQTQPADDGKADLINVLITKIKKTENDPEWTAAGVAQMVYNNAAHWMNKTHMFNDRPGEPLQTKAPFAPEQ